MIEKLKIDFEKTIQTSSFSEHDVKTKKKYLNKFLENGFPSRKLENWKFLDINQIIQKNIEDISFYNDYSKSNKIDTTIFIDPGLGGKVDRFGNLIISRNNVS